MQSNYVLSSTNVVDRTLPEPDGSAAAIAATAQAEAVLQSDATDDGPYNVTISGGEDDQGRKRVTLDFVPYTETPPLPGMPSSEITAVPPVQDDGG